jgi:hypothetical protein
MSFVIRALPSTPFAPLFDLPADELVARGGLRRVATTSPGFPCRVSLRDAEPGPPAVVGGLRGTSSSPPARLGAIRAIRDALQNAGR